MCAPIILINWFDLILNCKMRKLRCVVSYFFVCLVVPSLVWAGSSMALVGWQPWLPLIWMDGVLPLYWVCPRLFSNRLENIHMYGIQRSISQTHTHSTFNRLSLSLFLCIASSASWMNWTLCLCLFNFFFLPLHFLSAVVRVSPWATIIWLSHASGFYQRHIEWNAAEPPVRIRNNGRERQKQ